MKEKTLSHQNLIKILDLSSVAPSAHNTQSWQTQIQGTDLVVTINEQRTLKDGDPSGRQAMTGLGIFCEAIIMAAASIGLQVYRVSLENGAAKIGFKKGQADTEIAGLMKKRATDRSIYRLVDIDQRTIERVIDCSKGLNVTVRVITDRQQINHMALLTSKGIRLALSSPDFRKEISQHLVVPWSKKQIGISVYSLYIFKPLAIIEPLLMRWGIGLGLEAKLEKKRWESPSAVVTVTTPGDMPEDWFAAGRAYYRACIEIERAGLAQATSAALVEASTFHEDIEEMLGTKQRLQTVLRVGLGAKKRYYSPRIKGENLITSS